MLKCTFIYANSLSCHRHNSYHVWGYIDVSHCLFHAEMYYTVYLDETLKFRGLIDTLNKSN